METGEPHPTFSIEIVGEAAGPLQLAGGVPIVVQNSIDNIDACDIVIVPSVWMSPSGWDSGRYPRVVAWLKQVHARGAGVCSEGIGRGACREGGGWDVAER